MKPRVFDRFAQDTKIRSSEGPGLPIVKMLEKDMAAGYGPTIVSRESRHLALRSASLFIRLNNRGRTFFTRSRYLLLREWPDGLSAMSFTGIDQEPFISDREGQHLFKKSVPPAS